MNDFLATDCWQKTSDNIWPALHKYSVNNSSSSTSSGGSTSSETAATIADSAVPTRFCVSAKY